MYVTMSEPRRAAPLPWASVPRRAAPRRAAAQVQVAAVEPSCSRSRVQSAAAVEFSLPPLSSSAAAAVEFSLSPLSSSACLRCRVQPAAAVECSLPPLSSEACRRCRVQPVAVAEVSLAPLCKPSRPQASLLSLHRASTAATAAVQSYTSTLHNTVPQTSIIDLGGPSVWRRRVGAPFAHHPNAGARCLSRDECGGIGLVRLDPPPPGPFPAWTLHRLEPLHRADR